MSSNDGNASPWENTPQDSPGPSFEDPSQPAAPAPGAPASGQDWDRAWGMADDAQPVGDVQSGPGATGWGTPAGQNQPPMQGGGYGSGPQTTPYGGAAPMPQGAPYGGQPMQPQNPYAQQFQGQDPYATQAGGYQPQPYAAYGYSQPAKSKTTAALLAFFLGGLGVHSFYLGKKNLGFIHLGIFLAGLVIMIIGAVAGGMSGDPDSGLFALAGMGYMVIIGNNIWAFVEFIIILVKPEHELGR